MLYPLLVLLAAFLIDKLPFIGEFPYYFIKSASYANYDHKEKMLFELADYLKQPQRKRVLVIFGNSRTMPFENRYFDAHYPDWILYNFSVPGGTSDYFYYLMERFQELSIRPDFLIFTITPQGFNDAASIQMDEVMLRGLPASFIFQNLSHYKVDDITNYIAKKLFWSYRDKPVPSVISRRLKNHSAEMKALKEFVLTSTTELERTRGSVPTSQIEPRISQAMLSKHAESIWHTFLDPFRYSNDQDYFTDRSLAIATGIGIPSALLWAKVSPQLRRLKETVPVERTKEGEEITLKTLWSERIEKLAVKHDVPMLDMNFGQTIRCDDFFDASHMAGGCFGEFTDYLMHHIKSRLDQRKIK